jgi:hypothetical protein
MDLSHIHLAVLSISIQKIFEIFRLNSGHYATKYYYRVSQLKSLCLCYDIVTCILTSE